MPSIPVQSAARETGGVSRAANPRLHVATAKIREDLVLVTRQIATGTISEVFEGSFEGHPVAIKRMRPDLTRMHNPATMREFEVEVGKMMALNHPCVVRCFGILEPNPGVLLELVKGGSIFDIINQVPEETVAQYSIRLPWPVRMRYLLDGLYGLRAVHASGLIHGDFKTQHLLVGDDHRVKLSCFSLSAARTPDPGELVGTPQYMAPEVMQGLPQTMRVDIYSFGVVMWEILTGEVPFRNLDVAQIIQTVTAAENATMVPPPGRPQMLESHEMTAPQGFVPLVYNAWAQDPNDRPTAEELVQVLEGILSSTAGLQAKRSQYGTGPMQYQMPTNTPLQPSAVVRTSAHVPFHQSYLQGGPGGAGAPKGGVPVAGIAVDEPPPSKRLRSGAGGSAQPHMGIKTQTKNIPTHFNAMLETPIGQPLAQANQWKPPDAEFVPPAIFMEVGGMDVLTAMLHPDRSNEEQMQGASAVFEACANNTRNQTRLAQTEGEGCAALVELTRKHGCPEIQNMAAQAIAAACTTNGENRKQVVEAGGVSALLAMAQNPSEQMQENGANALANIFRMQECDQANVSSTGWKAGKPPSGSLNAQAREAAKAAHAEAVEGLRTQNGMSILVDLMRSGPSRVMEAATAAVANAMEASPYNRKEFDRLGGLELVLGILKKGDPRMQENAMTALWNFITEDKDSEKKLAKAAGAIPLLVQQVHTGTNLGQELAAVCLWKICSHDDQTKDQVAVAIPGLVQLLLSGTRGAQELAAGALRSASIGSRENKESLRKCGGIPALLRVIKQGGKAGVQACAALANACATNASNQKMAGEQGAVPLLLEQIQQSLGKRGEQGEMVECAVTGIRNLCDNNTELQAELGKCGGIEVLVSVLGEPGQNIDWVGDRQMEAALGALWKGCAHSQENRDRLEARGLARIKQLYDTEQATAEVRRSAAGVLQLVALFAKKSDI